MLNPLAKRELAKIDENRRPVGIMKEPSACIAEGAYRGVEGTAPVTMACPEKGDIRKIYFV